MEVGNSCYFLSFRYFIYDKGFYDASRPTLSLHPAAQQASFAGTKLQNKAGTTRISRIKSTPSLPRHVKLKSNVQSAQLVD